jgi:hypothetical protein
VIVLTIALATLVLVAEIRGHGRHQGESEPWVLPAAAGLTVAIGALILQRLLPILAR